MKIDGINLINDSALKDAVVESGTSLPVANAQDNGRLFFLTQAVGENQPGLYIYDATDAAWEFINDNSGISGSGGSQIGGWVAVNMSSQTILDSFNVASVSFASGDFTVFWDTDFTSNNYTVSVSHSQNNGVTYGAGVLSSQVLTDRTRIQTYANGSGTNLPYVSVIAMEG